MHEHRLRSLSMRAAVGALSVLCVTGLLSYGLTWRLDTWIYDFLLSRFEQQVDERILVVAIDERSLSELGRWPWSRGVHADLLERLDHADVHGVILNAVFAEPARDDEAGDTRLAEALAHAGNVVLPVMAEASEPGGMPVEVMPMPALIEAAASLGHVDAEVDRDGVARHAYLFAGLGSPHWRTLALALLHARPDPHGGDRLPGLLAPPQLQGSPYQWVRDRHIMIPYAAPGAIPQASYIDVLHGRVDPTLLRGRWVLVGVTAGGIDQGLLTPLNRNGGRLSTIEYHANLLNALVLEQAIIPFTPLQQWALAVVLALLPLALYSSHSPWLRAWLVSALAAVATLACCMLLLRYGRYWFQPTPTLVVLAASYVAWTVYRLRHSQRLAHSDGLTHLANRRMFDLMLGREIRAAQRSRQPLSLLLIDVDHFKHFNDRYGHQAGDDVLRQVSGAILAHARRPRDLAARYGGDELAAILPETSSGLAAGIADAIVRHVRALAIPHDESDVAPRVTVTIGLATYDPRRDPADIDLIERADTALYHAKREGRNRSHGAEETAAQT